MKIHTIGDSHAYNGWEIIKKQALDINISSIGPLLCYSFGRDRLERINLKKLNVENDDIVIFCLGEIDCRCHIQKHITSDKTYNNIIDNIVENYFKAIEENVKQYSRLNVCVFNVVPPVQKYNTNESPEYPFLGTDEQRKDIVLYFNKKLSEKCIEYN